MQKWEYQVTEITFPGRHHYAVKAELDEQGAKGWELVNWDIVASTVAYLWKRPLP